MKPASRAALFALALLALPATASADRVVVGSIRGDDGDSIRERVETTLRERVEVVPWSEFRAAYRGLDAEAIRAACRAVDARAIVLGDVQGSRRLNLMALSCETGEIASESQVDLRRGVPRADSLYAAVAAMFFEQGAQSLLTWATRGRGPSPAPGAAPARAASPASAPRPTATATPAVAPPVAAPAPAAADDDPPAATASETVGIAALLGPAPGSSPIAPAHAHATDDEGPAPAVDAQLEAAPSPFAFLEASVGATFATRTLDVVDRSGRSVGYSGGGYTELGGQVTLFPLAVVSRAGWARAIGLTGAFVKGVAVQSASSGLEVDTLDGGVGLLGRFALGRSIELRPQASYGFRGFAIDWNPDIATFNYRFVRLGVDARAALLRRPTLAEGTVGALSVGVTGGVRLVTDLGEAADAYGTDASGYGWDAGAFASILLGKSLEITAGAELARFTSSFAGAGSLERLASKSDDTFPRAFVRAGLALR